ncbi:unnamed protein product, partial [Rotaria sp. Silwood1]
MVRKKSTSAKARTRKRAYERKKTENRVNRSWRKLLLIVTAVNKFLRLRRCDIAVACSTSDLNTSQSSKIFLNNVSFVQKDIEFTYVNKTDAMNHLEDLNVVQATVKYLISKVCRLDYERKRQLEIRKKTTVLKSTRQSSWFHKKYSQDNLFRKRESERVTAIFQKKYTNNSNFREKEKIRSRTHGLEKYRKYVTFRQEKIQRSKTYILNKYHNNMEFRNTHKANVLAKYNSNQITRLRIISQALNSYKKNYTPMMQKQRRLYNQSRRILNKYNILQSHICLVKHRNLYVNNLNRFRQIIREGPDYVCISCRLALFRNQVVPFVEKKYIKENMSGEIKKRIQSYFNYSSSSQSKWICKLCSDKIKKRQMPSRTIVNKLKVCDVPSELKELNNLEKHLIALRLPFMKIVNLTSGKLSNRLSQKGTKGPLHCVPSDVQDTVTALPRPVDKSMMVRLQLKRRLKYKAVWEEQLINPNDVRDALFVLTRMHPGYRNININDINENYLTSDQEKEQENNTESVIEPMDVDTNEKGHLLEETEVSDKNRLKALALGDIDTNTNNDEEIDDDDKDIRTKYNIGTDSCTQPCDFNDFLVFDKEPCVVAPAEKNKLSSLLTDKTIEALAFPHLFPDGEGSYDEERETNLKWKEYCKARLFSSDSRFAADSSYIFYLQYLGDLKQVYSGINIAFRKKLPMSAKQSLDEMQMKFLMNKDMIYRHLQCVRGSPQYWYKRLKDLFGMTRQLGFPTFFLTLSCADLRWKEFTDTFVRHTGAPIKESYTFEEKTKLLRANPVLAARLFEKRFNTFMNLFIKGGASCLGIIEDW